MGNWIGYEGETLGNLHLSRTEEMYLLVMDNLENLEKLLKLDEEDIIELDTMKMSYKEFREKYLTKSEAIYIDPASFFRREANFPIGTYVPRELEKAFQKNQL